MTQTPEQLAARFLAYHAEFPGVPWDEQWWQWRALVGLIDDGEAERVRSLVQLELVAMGQAVFTDPVTAWANEGGEG